MNVKRTSYFTFLVAITTLATVTSCNKVKEQLVQSKSNAIGEIVLDNNQDFFNICLDGLGQLDYRFEIAKVLRNKGLTSGKFKLAIDKSGRLSVYLVIDKDYKGPVSAKIFDSKNHNYGSLVLAVNDQPDNSSFAATTFDKRAGIAIKNRILRE